MDIEERQLLKDVKALLEDNHKMLKKLRRAQIVSSIMRTVYWLVIVGVAIGSLYFIQPYIDQLFNLYKSLPGLSDGVNVPLPGF